MDASAPITLESWLIEQLSRILGGLPAEESQGLAQQLLGIPEQSTLESYLTDFLGPDNQSFIRDFVQRRFDPIPKASGEKRASPPNTWLGKWGNAENLLKKEQLNSSLDGNRGYRKQEPTAYIKGADRSTRIPASQLISERIVTSAITNANSKSNSAKKDQQENANSSKKSSPTSKKSGGSKKQKRPQFDPSSIVGDKKIGFSGRLYCECLASRHGLVGNCMSCGKIVCGLEGPGPCSFCGADVTEDKSSTKPPSAKLVPVSSPDPEALANALNRKDILLEYDRNFVARTHVHDEASDFRDNVDNKWLGAEERALSVKRLQEQERKVELAKSRRVITLDLKNRVVYDSTPKPPNVAALSLSDSTGSASESSRLDFGKASSTTSSSARPMMNPYLAGLTAPVFVSSSFRSISD